MTSPLPARRRDRRAWLATLLVLAACTPADGADEKKGGPRGPATVGVIVLQPSDVPIERELVGRVAPVASAEVRPQISGLVRARLFTEGSFVRAGQPLYRIAPDLYDAGVSEAEANLEAARASAEAARVRADRFRPLAEMQAISRQEYTDALGQARVASAGVGQAQARLETARTSLDFTTVRAPISGRIGRSLVTEGALVTTNQATPLAIVQRTDPVFVDLQQSGAGLVALRRAIAQGQQGGGSPEVRLTLEDGSAHGPAGRLLLTEAIVDPATGTATLRASVPNPGGLLLPGMLVRAKIAQAVQRGAILVPQASVSRDEKGAAKVWIVGPDGKAAQRTITTAGTRGSDWIVTAGIAPGDRLITEGTGNLKPGAPVKAVPAGSPERIAPPPAKAG